MAGWLQVKWLHARKGKYLEFSGSIKKFEFEVQVFKNKMAYIKYLTFLKEIYVTFTSIRTQGLSESRISNLKLAFFKTKKFLTNVANRSSYFLNNYNQYRHLSIKGNWDCDQWSPIRNFRHVFWNNFGHVKIYDKSILTSQIIHITH